MGGPNTLHIYISKFPKLVPQQNCPTNQSQLIKLQCTYSFSAFLICGASLFHIFGPKTL